MSAREELELMSTHSKRALHILAILATVLTLPVRAAVTNGGFETGFTGWTRVDQVGSDGTFAIQSGTTSPVNAFAVPAPPAGINAAMTDAGGPGSHVLYQDFVVPAGPGPFVLTFRTYVGNGHGAGDFFVPALTTLDFATPALNQQARVDVVTTAADPFSIAAADVLLNAFSTSAGDPLVSGYTLRTVDVTGLFLAHPGETLRLRFAAVDNVAPFNFGVDDVAIASIPLASKTVTGTFLSGSVVTYTVQLLNGIGQPDNPGNEFTDVLPPQVALTGVTASSGTAVATIGTNTVTWNGAMTAGVPVTITITGTLSSSVAGGTVVSNQGGFFADADGSGSNDTNVPTDDPSQPGSADATDFVVAELPTATKTVAGSFTPGSAATYVVTLSPGSLRVVDGAGAEFTDVLPAGVVLVSATASAGTATATTATNTVAWNGAIASGGTVTITINATVRSDLAAGTAVSNQGTFRFDTNGDTVNDGTLPTDDPSVAGAADPTTFVSTAALATIPALDPLNLLILACALALAATFRMLR